MSRYCAKVNVGPILDAAARWKKVALLDDGSVFTDKRLWTIPGLEGLERYFVQNFDEGEGGFIEKLKGQLSPTAPEVKQLAAEMMWVLLLCPNNTLPPKKRETVREIWQWSNEPFPDTAKLWMSDEVLGGVGSAGPGFNNHRWRELVFSITVLLLFKRMPFAERQRLLGNGWEFAGWLQTISGADARQFRHMLLFLLFPDDFERIFGGTERRAIAVALSGIGAHDINAQSALELDRTLSRLRTELEAKYGKKEFDFYEPPLSPLWRKGGFSERTKPIQREHVLAAIDEIDRNGAPPDADSTTYDLIFGERRYPPKLVLSLASKYASGEVFDRAAFSGGEKSPAFKLLRELGFHIERKDFVEQLVRDFLAQAQAQDDLSTTHYPRTYRGLSVVVSFGKGNFARIPWISFLGAGQKTSKGIYPGYLLFREIGVLLLTYGVSEENESSVQWKNLPQVQSVREFLASNYQTTPERYGEAFVAAAYKVLSDIHGEVLTTDLDKVINAYQTIVVDTETVGAQGTPKVEELEEESPIELVTPPYTVEMAMEGLFLPKAHFEGILRLLSEKKNVIVQGPPGVGKTFFSKRLANALIGEDHSERLGMVQFHQSYAYEDFIQGYRPTGTGFALKDGIFHQFCTSARVDPENDYAFIIDEINRSNLSKVFGDLMMLIETDKRGEQWAIPLTYAKNAGLNEEITKDKTNLGPGFCVGHSFFCATPSDRNPDEEWYRQVVNTEIAPLLREYWFDDPTRADDWTKRLTA